MQLAATAQAKAAAGLARMLDGTPDALLDFADRAESARGRQGFYDATAEMGRNRVRIEQSFARRVKQGFNDFLAQSADRTGPAAAPELSLVDKDDFENRLAIETIAGRAAKQFHGELYALRQRLAVINRGIKTRDAELPAGPLHLTRAFAQSLQGLGIEKRIKLLLYALFYKSLVASLPELYEALNTRLIEAGVLPYLKRVVENPERASPERKPPLSNPAADAPASLEESPRFGPAPAVAPATRTSPPLQAAPAAAGGVGVSDLVLKDLLDLMGRRRGGPGKPAASPDQTPGGAPPIPLQELAEVISGPQAAVELPGAAQTLRQGTEIAPQLSSELMAQISAALARQRDTIVTLAGPERLRTIDSDTIDLVGMLFEYMLSAEELPNAVKALLSHLHTPYLKLAMADQSFLDRPDHPARLLLDLMIEAGSTQVVETDLRRGFYPDLRNAVNRILADFKDDVGLFEELLGSLRGRLDAQRDRAKALEKRSRQAEQGREQLKLAQSQARTEIRTLMDGQELPQVVINFLDGFIAEKLTLMLLRGTHARQSPDWNRTIELIRTLVRVCCREGLERWRVNRPRLAGLQKVIGAEPRLLGSYYSRQVEELLGWLAEVEHGASARAVEQFAAPPPPPESPASAEQRRPLSPEQVSMVERLRGVEFGTLFELRPDGEERVQRLRLSWYNPTTARYMFVNQDGLTAAVKDVAALARELVDGQARMVSPPGRPFMERALDAIRGTLGRRPGDVRTRLAHGEKEKA